MQILSVQIDRPFLRAALIDKSKNKIEIRALKASPLSSPQDVKALYIPSFQGEVVSALSGKDLFLRSTELKVGKSRHLEQLLSIQSEATSYFSPEEILHVFHVPKKGKEALLISVAREKLKAHLEELEELEISPDRVSAWPFGLVQYIKWKLPTLTDAFLIDLGSSEWTCVWMAQGELKKSYTLERGVEDLLNAFWEDQKQFLLRKELDTIAKQTDLNRLKPPDLPLFYKKLSEMRQELAKVCFSFYRLAGKLPVIFTGRIDAFLNFRANLVENFREVISAECNSSLPVEELKFAVCLGSVLNHSPQLCQEEFFPKKHWKIAGKKALALLFSSLVLAASLFAFGIKIADQRKLHLLSSLKTALSLWDPTLKKDSRDPEVLLNQWSRAIHKENKEYPYIMQAPKVAEVLSWLTQLSPSFGIEIQQIHYQLCEFPHLGSSKEPYRTKLELEFQAQSPLDARKFHEFLLKGEKWVDGEEISWETFNEGYRTSFFLKNKGPYVP